MSLATKEHPIKSRLFEVPPSRAVFIFYLWTLLDLNSGSPLLPPIENIAEQINQGVTVVREHAKALNGEGILSRSNYRYFKIEVARLKQLYPLPSILRIPEDASTKAQVNPPDSGGYHIHPPDSDENNSDRNTVLNKSTKKVSTTLNPSDSGGLTQTPDSGGYVKKTSSACPSRAAGVTPSNQFDSLFAKSSSAVDSTAPGGKVRSPQGSHGKNASGVAPESNKGLLGLSVEVSPLAEGTLAAWQREYPSGYSALVKLLDAELAKVPNVGNLDGFGFKMRADKVRSAYVISTLQPKVSV